MDRKQTRNRIKLRYRDKVLGDQTRPRLSVYRSLKHISVQAIDDNEHKVLASASTYEKQVKEALNNKTGNKDASSYVGKMMGERLKEKGIETAVFDRNGFRYHGVIQCLADAIREQGIAF